MSPEARDNKGTPEPGTPSLQGRVPAERASGVRSALNGLRVVDFSWGLAGALASLLLADFGAEVLKVEPPGGDPLRAEPGFYLWGRGKRSLVLDLHQPADRAQAADLAAGADVVLHTFRPPAAARFGLTYAELATRNPGLIVGRIGGAGLTGRYAGVKGYEATAAARIGL